MKNNNLEKGKKYAWKLFEKTGEIKYYGAYKSLDELQKSKQIENEEQTGFSF